MDQKHGRISDEETQKIILKSRTRFIKKYTDEYTAYHAKCRAPGMFAGLLAIPGLIVESIAGNECLWEPDIIELEGWSRKNRRD